MKPQFKYIFMCLSIFSSLAMAEIYTKKEIMNYTLKNKCLDKSYKSALGKNRQGVDQDRNNDLDYSSCIDPLCCCTSQINSLFKDDTKDMTQNRVNPATDKLIEALRNQRVASDIKIVKLVHLKYVNAIYSFYDKNGEKMKNEELTMPDDDNDGCKKTITFRKLEKKDLERTGVYREGMLKDILAMLHAWKKSDKMIADKNMINMVK